MTAMKYLAGVCDGANSQDAAGFAKGDSYNGKYLASASYWDESDTTLAVHFAHKYRRQLTHLDLSGLPDSSPDVYKHADSVTNKRRSVYNKKMEKPKVEARVYFDEKDKFIYSVMEYNEDFLYDARKIGSRKWQGGNVNRFSPADVDAVLDLAKKYELPVEFDRDEVIKFSPAVVAVNSLKKPLVEKKIYAENGMVKITFPYTNETLALVKSLKLAIYKPEPTPHWEASVESVKRLCDALLPHGFSTDDTIKALLGQQKTAKESYNLGSTDFRAEIKELRPEFDVLPHQWVAIEKIVKNSNVLNADSQGLGKTFVTLVGGLIRGSKRILIVAPSSLTENWANETKMFFKEDTFRVFKAEGRTPSEIPEDANVVILGWPNLSFWLDTIKAWKADMVAVDEAHYGKSGKTSQRGKAYIELGKHSKRAGVVKIALTGTPILNRPLEILAAIQFFGIEKEFGGVTRFKNQYCGPQDIVAPPGVKTYKKDSKGRYLITTYNGASNLEELHDILVSSGIYIRRTKKLLMEQGLLGKKYVNGLEFFDYEGKRKPFELTLTSSEWDEYTSVFNEFQKNIQLKIEALAVEMGLSPNHPKVRNAFTSNKGGDALVLLGELRRRIGQIKIRAVKEEIKKLVARGERVLVFAHHRDVVDAYAKEFSGIKIQGGMKPSQVEEAKRKFNATSFEENPVLVVSIEAGKTGHTLCLQKKNGVGQECAYVIFAEEPYVYGDAEQAEDRVYRIGQSRDVHILNMIVPGTADEDIYFLREKKRAVFNSVIDGVSLEDDEDEEGIAQQIIRGYVNV